MLPSSNFDFLPQVDQILRDVLRHQSGPALVAGLDAPAAPELPNTHHFLRSGRHALLRSLAFERTLLDAPG